MAEFDKIKYKIGVIDSFMSTKTDNMFYANVKDFEKTTKIINDTYDRLIKSVYSGLYPQTVQNRYGDLIDIVVDVKDGNLLFGLDVNRLVSDFKARLDVGGQTAMSAFGDIMEYFAYLQAQTQPNIVGRDKLVDLIEHVVSSVPKHELDGWINGIDFKIDRELPIKMGDAQNNHLNGGILFAGVGNDNLTGTQNSDLLFGQDGNDRLIGGNGDDLLNGGAGDDYLQGGTGVDTFVFSLDMGLAADISQIGFDKIADFNLDQGDKIDLAGLFDDGLTLDNFGDYVYFEKTATRNITMMVDIDGKNGDFEKVAIADIYSNNVDSIISRLNQGEGLIL